jgi:mRNA-degrading endonuclease RelE of RelBE toxin-antitoxin system
MSTVAEIESAIKKLDPKKIRRIGDWLDELRERLFDEQIDADAKAGRLDKMIAKAKADYRAGKARAFP